jgi:hypothetical protein
VLLLLFVCVSAAAMCNHSYVQLRTTPLQVTDLTSSNLQTQYVAIKAAIAANAGSDLGPDQLTSFSAILLNEQTVPGFKDALAAGSISFLPNACDLAFAGYSGVRVRTVGGRLPRMPQHVASLALVLLLGAQGTRSGQPRIQQLP